MRLLVDTHVLLWILSGEPELAAPLMRALADPASEVFASIASLWEIAIKVRIGKLRVDLQGVLGAFAPPYQLLRLGIEPSHVVALSRLDRVDGHRDPFDQLLVAQAMVEGLTLVTRDGRLREYPVSVMRA